MLVASCRFNEVELLLRKRVLVDTGNSDGRTAMHLAASEGRDHVMKLLIKAEGQIHWMFINVYHQEADSSVASDIYFSGTEKR